MDGILYQSRTVVAVVTGTEKPSDNAKTGWMAQVWILPKAGLGVTEQRAVCLRCPLQPALREQREAGVWGCYVIKHRAPLNVWRRWREGAYPEIQPDALRRRMVRWGAWGEPVLVPERIVAAVNECAAGWTGYTHAWRAARFQAHRRWFMASVESEAGALEAQALGWRTYRMLKRGEEAGARELACPGRLSFEDTNGTTCDRCLRCDGRTEREGAGNITVRQH
jgi:hypothetical protein